MQYTVYHINGPMHGRKLVYEADAVPATLPDSEAPDGGRIQRRQYRLSPVGPVGANEFAGLYEIEMVDAAPRLDEVKRVRDQLKAAGVPARWIEDAAEAAFLRKVDSLGRNWEVGRAYWVI